MTLSALGIFSAAGAGGAPVSSYELIETQILTGTQASVTFSGLGTYSSVYKQLQIRIAGRSTTAFSNENDSVYLRFNGDTGNNYSFRQLIGNASSVLSGGETGRSNIAVVTIASNGAGANIFGSGTIDILDPFSSTKNKTVTSLTGVYVSSQRFVTMRSGAWFNTASVTSVTLGSVDGNLVAGSRFSIYGVK